MEMTIRVQGKPFDAAAETARLKGPGVGAIVTFAGICRDEDGRLAALELEHYPGMAEAEMERIATEAAGRWTLHGATIIHRVGRIAVGDDIVLVAVASAHRDAAFEAARFMMDFLKTDAPFWKREHPVTGEARKWVAAAARDDDARARWRR